MGGFNLQGSITNRIDWLEIHLSSVPGNGSQNPEQTQDDQDEHNDEQSMNPTARPAPPKKPEQPENDEYDNDYPKQGHN